MDVLKTDLLQLIQYLLPGFLAAWIFYGLTPHVQATPFERVVEALIFTAIVQAALTPFRGALLWIGHWWSWGAWSQELSFFYSVCLATITGLVFASCANADWPHRLLRRWKLTRMTTFPSEWYSAFHRDPFPHWVVLHLKGEEQRRLYGWAEEYQMARMLATS